MKNLDKHFQETVEEYLLRHRSILDSTTKLQTASAQINRAIAKSVTQCGCLKIKAEKQRVPTKTTLKEAKNHLSTHLEGKLCDNCKEVISTEIGTTLFYITAVCVLLGLDLHDIIKQEQERISTLGVFSLT